MLGNITRWIVFSAPGEGKIQDIVSSFKKRGGGIQNFCDNLRWQSSWQSHCDLCLCPFHKNQEGKLRISKRPEMEILEW